MPKPVTSRRVALHIDYTAMMLIMHLQQYYHTSTAEYLRRSIDRMNQLCHTDTHPWRTVNRVPASIVAPVLVNFFLPTLMIERAAHHAEHWKISLPEYIRRAVIEYAAPIAQTVRDLSAKSP